jgi:hypothetical protein
MLDMLLNDAGFWKVSDIAYLDDVYIRAPKLMKFANDGKVRKVNWDFDAVYEQTMCSTGCKRTPKVLKFISEGNFFFLKNSAELDILFHENILEGTYANNYLLVSLVEKAHLLINRRMDSSILALELLFMING